jgi:hypothetical protein
MLCFYIIDRTYWISNTKNQTKLCARLNQATPKCRKYSPNLYLVWAAVYKNDDKQLLTQDCCIHWSLLSSGFEIPLLPCPRLTTNASVNSRLTTQLWVSLKTASSLPLCNYTAGILTGNCLTGTANRQPTNSWSLLWTDSKSKSKSRYDRRSVGL